MESRKVHFTLSREALAIIDDRAPSKNKRGDWISKALVEYDAIQRGVAKNDDGAGVLEKLEARMGRIEQMLTALLLESNKG